MKDFQSVQDLIIKAALYDGISTTISAGEQLCRGDALRVTFSRDNRYTSTYIDLVDTYRDPEETALYCCRRALYKLLCGKYEEIEVVKEHPPCTSQAD